MASRRTFMPNGIARSPNIGWNPCLLAKNCGFREHELNHLERLVVQYQQTFIEA